jgi:hypothetical protein
VLSDQNDTPPHLLSSVAHGARVGVVGDKTSDTDLFRSDMHRSPAGTVVRLPNPSYRHATTGGRHRQPLYRFICFKATSYHYAISASHDEQRLANHSTRSRLVYLHLLWSRWKERICISFSTRSDEREMRSPLSVLLPTQRLAASGELSFRLGLGRVDGEETAYSCKKLLRMLSRKAQALHRRRTDRPEASEVLSGWACTGACASPRLAYPPPRHRLLQCGRN